MDPETLKAIGALGAAPAMVALMFYTIKSYRDAIADNTKATYLMARTLTRVCAKLDVDEAKEGDE